ncbi:hypothetical protein HanXRQr2_Chr02g0072771 [Helianthus annuus]|uniref:Uncharacterized protein n=1 Tax=Helianthus annuus TaxID=4232 RepID=A0A9K3JPR9_HELAN|nr:hypothetical protein HanXRQr2_Chr02g0072771 [Helianthus annuus]
MVSPNASIIYLLGFKLDRECIVVASSRVVRTKRLFTQETKNEHLV